MASEAAFDSWSAGQSYERYMGRWSRKIAVEYLDWLAPPRNADWLEIGAGTGALTAAVLASCAPRSVVATDRSEDFVAHLRDAMSDPRLRVEVADAQSLPSPDSSVDVVASALVLNFVPDRAAALSEMRRVLRPGGLLSFYVWDYPGGGMGFIDAFWKAAATLDPEVAKLDEGTRFPFCTRDGLAALCREAGVPDPEVSAIESETAFPDIEALWQPFTLGAGPAPGYCKSLSEEGRSRLKRRLADELGGDGPVRLTARAWAVRAAVP